MIESEEQRERDRLTTIVPNKETRKAHTRAASLETIKSAYIAEGLSVEELCERFAMTPEKANSIVSRESLNELRNSYRKEGLRALQEVQVDQAQRMVELEAQFKKLQLIQLETKLENYLAYYMRHGDLIMRHPVTEDPMMDSNGMPIQLNIPSLIREIGQLKSSMELTHGMKSILLSIDEVIHQNSNNGDNDNDDGIVDLNDINEFFEQK